MPLRCCHSRDQPSDMHVVDLCLVISLPPVLLLCAEVPRSDHCRDSDRRHSVPSHLHHSHRLQRYTVTVIYLKYGSLLQKTALSNVNQYEQAATIMVAPGCIALHVSKKLPLPLEESVTPGAPSNIWFLWSTKIQTQNGTSISSAVFAGLTNVSDRQKNTQRDRQTDRPHDNCSKRLHLMLWNSDVVAQ